MRSTQFTYSANLSIMFTEHDLLARPSAAAAAGFTHVEMWWPFPEPVAGRGGLVELLSAIEQADVALAGLNFWAGDMPGGERGVASHPNRAHELRANTEQMLEIAQATGCRQFNLLYGQRNSLWTDAEQDTAAVSAITAAAEAVEPIGGTVLLEPLATELNGAYPLTDPAHVVTMLQTTLAHLPNVRLLFDMFHIGSNGIDIVESVPQLAPWIGHVQLADSPGRAEPGSGKLPIAGSLEALTAAGYAGLVACEYRPTTPRTQDSLGWIGSRS